MICLREGGGDDWSFSSNGRQIGKLVCRLDSKSSFTVDVEVFHCTEAPDLVV
jgi:hypothetical protein